MVINGYRPGRPPISTSNAHVQKIKDLEHANGRLTEELSEEVSNSVRSCHDIFTYKLNMCDDDDDDTTAARKPSERQLPEESNDDEIIWLRHSNKL
ncbi:hypothetical protein Trydic_g19026 [Trypoxylus dichotomus]